MSCTSLTDPSVAPEGKENLFFLIPLAPGLKDTDEMREKYFNIVTDRLNELTGNDIKDKIVFKKSYCVSDFEKDYNAFKGNAYGLANTLRQTAVLKPRMKNNKINNLFYTGQLTVPGPGVPPSIISGQVVAKEINYKANVEEIINVCTKKTKVCFIANPNNPTGTYLTRNELTDLRENLPQECLLVIDSAYAEYVEKDDYTNGFDLVNKFNNVACTRTFSKIYGLAALRIGWAYASLEVIDYLNRIRLPFNINTIAQHAAIAAIQDKDFIEKAIEHNNVWKPFIEKELINLGLSIVPGVGNFVLTKFDNSDEANNCYNYLEKHNIFVRKVSEYGLADCLRITIGLEEENIFLIKIINDFMKNN